MIPNFFDPPVAASQMDQRKVAMLRLLGRLEFLPTDYLWKLVTPDAGRRWVQLILTAMEKEGLVWRTRVPHRTLPHKDGTTPPPRNPDVWGMTTEGRMLLETLEVEHDQRSLDGLRYRDPRGRPVSSMTLKHDLQASWWCASMLFEAQRNAFVQSVFVQVEYVSHERQRIDAMVVLRITPKRRRADIGTIPWFDGSYRRQDEIEVRLAIEIDRGTEPLKTLLEKAVTYRDLTAEGVYTRALGGSVMPVFVVPTMTRAGQIAREWQDAWEEGWGVISPLNQASHPRHGVLWGTYKSMRAGDKGAVVPLLTSLALNAKGQVVLEPVMSLEQWQTGISEVETHTKKEDENA
jgi:hypothetical protein